MKSKTLSSIKEMYEYIRKIDKPIFIIIGFQAAVDASAPFFNSFIISLIVDCLIKKVPIINLTYCVFLSVLGNAIISVLHIIFDSLYNKRAFICEHQYMKLKTKAFFDIDYEKLDTTYFSDLRQKIRFSDDNMGTLLNAVGNFKKVMYNIISAVIAMIIISNLFANVIQNSNNVFVNITSICLVSIFFGIIIMFVIILMKKMQKKVENTLPILYNNMASKNRLALFLAERVIYNYNMGKDIRIYNISEIIELEFVKMIKNMGNIHKKIGVISNLPSAVSSAFSMIIGIIIYIFMSGIAYLEIISIGNVVFYANVIKNFVESITSLSFSLGEFTVISSKLSPTKELFELALTNKTSELICSSNIKLKDLEIRFDNVSFCYPNTTDYSLKNISFSIHRNERISIVGKNGAGKTTVIKLLAKLYKPTSGHIFFNNIDINYISDEEYRKLISFVFQDFKLFSFSISDNLSLSNECNSDLIYKTCRMVGFEDKLNTLDDGINTVLYHDYCINGIELSGGESQKIALARCLYLQTPIMILDEPTSALDPRTEAEIYEKFNEFSQGKTAIFVSHRLSYCQLSDKIIVLDNGSISQIGSHNELVMQNGIYKKLWRAQEQYYKD